jgi:hypothetical protein
MRNRLALFAASLAASGMLAAGIAFVGMSPAPVPAADSTIVAPISDATPQPVTQVDTIYVAPQATPAEVVVTEVAPAEHHGDDGDEHEGGESHEGGDD